MKKLLMVVVFATMLYSCSNPPPPDQTTEVTKVAPVDTTPREIGLADLVYKEKGQRMFSAFESGDMDKYLSMFSEDALYRWNNGDSLTGKTEISNFWRKRRLEEVSTIKFSNQIWLPVKVNQPQSVEAPGVWLLLWSKVEVIYKNKKSMAQWMHFAIHFDETDHVDRVVQYVDTAPVNAAMPMMH